MRTTNTSGVRAEYFHEKASPKARRVRRCVVFYPAPLSILNQSLADYGLIPSRKARRSKAGR